jgi:Zn-dependent protease
VLSFRVGPFPVTVYPWFFISAVLLGGGLGFGWRMLVWIFVVFVSVLVHELGHAVVGKLYGGRPEIRLEAFGGVTYPQFQTRPTPGKQFVLSVSGPLAGLALGALCLVLVNLVPPAPASPAAFTMQRFIEVSVTWAAFNLVPMLPLDGGQMMLATIEWVRKKPSIAVASWISVAVSVAVAAAVFLFLGLQPFILLFCGLFAFQNIARARAARGIERPPPGQETESLEQAEVERATQEARAAVSRGDFNAALAAAERLESAGGPYGQAAGLRLRAGVELSRGDNEAAALLAGQSFSLFQTPDAAVVAARANLRAGREERARNWLRRALEAGAPQAALQADPELGLLGIK